VRPGKRHPAFQDSGGGRDKHYGDLPEELLKQETKSGDVLILNRIGWAKAYLKEEKFIEQPARGQVKITPKGLLALKRGALTLRDLKSDLDYIKCQELKIINEKAMLSINSATDEETPQDLIDRGFEQIEKEVKVDLLSRYVRQGAGEGQVLSECPAHPTHAAPREMGSI